MQIARRNVLEVAMSCVRLTCGERHLARRLCCLGLVHSVPVSILAVLHQIVAGEFEVRARATLFRQMHQV